MADCENCGLPTNSKNTDETHCQPCVELIESHPSVQVTPLEPSDLELVLAWRSHPRIYEHFREQNSPLSWDEHMSWFNSREPDCYDFVIRFDGRRVGVVNINSTNEVGIFLGEFSAHGNGIATATLEWLCHRFENRTALFAEIRGDNEASKQLFTRCGFTQCGCDNEWEQYVYES